LIFEIYVGEPLRWWGSSFWGFPPEGTAERVSRLRASGVGHCPPAYGFDGQCPPYRYWEFYAQVQATRTEIKSDSYILKNYSYWRTLLTVNLE